MANMLDYLYWRGDLTLGEAPFNPVDALILAWLSSQKLEGLNAHTVGEAGASLSETKLEENGLKYARLLAGSRRFGDMPLLRLKSSFSAEEEKQFAAITVLTGDGYQFIAYRGTDATLVGWKEDFNMAYSDEVPAQRESVRYLEEAAGMSRLPMRVGGHSKGGNLAVYAASKCAPAVQRRLAAVYNFDGPGLNAGVIQSEGYLSIQPRIETYLPQSSVVGILLEHTENFYVVRSTNVGVMQHDPYSWQVVRDGFETVPGLDQFSLYADRTLHDWLSSMDREQRKRFVDTVYQIVTSGGAKTLSDISEDWEKSGLEMLKAFQGLDFTAQLALIHHIATLMRAAVDNLT